MATPPNQMGLTGPVQPNDIVMRASEIGTTIPGIASLAMKSARKGAQRGVQGIYQLPSGQEPTPEFMNVSQQNLNNQTQQMTDMLNSMAPEDERLAYINEEEAGILKLLGGSGEMTPQGIPSFYGGQGPGGMGARGYGGGMRDSKGNSVGGGGGGGAAERERERQAEAAANAREQARAASVQAAAEQKEQDRQRREQSANAGNEMSELDRMAEAEDNVNKENVDTGNNDNVVTDGKGNPVTNTQVNEDGTTTTTNVTFGGPRTPSAPTYNPNLIGQYFGYYNPDYAAPGETTTSTESSGNAQENYVNSQIEYAQELASLGVSRDAAYAASGLDSYAGGIGLGGPEGGNSMTSADVLGNMGMEGRLGELRAKAKANNITSTELNELAQLNDFYGKNPTTGMGFLESLEYQVTNPEFVEGIKKVGPLLGAAALTAFAPLGVKSIFSIGKMLMDVTGKTPQSLRDTIQNALNKLTGGEKSALAKSLPSNYKGFGIQGQGQGGGGEDREAAKREAERKAREEAERKAREEEENNRKQDRFQRSFANRYFIGPASLDAVRKYATTEGGYNQLTPFYGREKETV
jgi:hypothetical protein